jgi:hypothetical protein
MANLKQIKERIQELAGRRKNVTLSEIAWVVDQLGENGFSVGSRANGHQTLFRVNDRRFGVCGHNPGGKQIKRCYVDEFIKAMIDVGLYDE